MLIQSQFITASPLDNFSIRYNNDQTKYVAQKLFPVLAVPKKTGQYYVYSKDNLRVRSTLAAHGTKAGSSDYAARKETYTCVPHAWSGLVLGADARDFDTAVGDLDTEQVQQNMDVLLIEMEAAAVTLACASGNYPSSLVTTLTDSSNRWSDNGGDPIGDIRTASQAVLESCGQRPNALALSQRGVDVLLQNPSIVDRVKYTQSGPATLQVLAGLFGLSEINVSDVVKNTAVEGAADSLSAIWTDSAVLYVNSPPSLKSMSYGKTFMVNRLYSKAIDAPELGRDLGAHWMETGFEYQLKATATVSSSDTDFAAGALIANIY